MLRTTDLMLDKARFSDWRAMYRNVWQHPSCAKYMTWRVTENEADAKARILRTIEFQKTHDTYLVYARETGEAVGFAGVEPLSPGVCAEAGICLSPGVQRKGFGGQILRCLMAYSRETYGAKEFLYTARQENEASRRLAISAGFFLKAAEEKMDQRTDTPYLLLTYSKRLL